MVADRLQVLVCWPCVRLMRTKSIDDERLSNRMRSLASIHELRLYLWVNYHTLAHRIILLLLAIVLATLVRN